MRRQQQSKNSPQSGEIVITTPTEPTYYLRQKEEGVEGLLLEEIE